jgi:uncharacterized RDD family membrane protein YckC
VSSAGVVTGTPGRTWRRQREIVTPEGVPLTVELAELSERVIALIIDLLIWLSASFALIVMLGVLTAKGLSGVIFTGVLMLTMFLVRVLYFIHFELSARGATPGKRLIGIRVTDRRGGPLTASAVIARNLTRELEIFLPVSMLISAAGGGMGVRWGYLLLLGWILCFFFLMFFNRDRMRAGDLIAGTIVIALPRQPLLGDLVATSARFVFTDQQLTAYGKRELQVLEDLLRRREDTETRALLHDVCDRICRKISWAEPLAPDDTALFLRDFYTAQRAFLEREQLFGRPRADKFEAAAKRD